MLANPCIVSLQRKVPSAARGAAYLESQMGTTDWQKEGLRDMAGITNVQMSVSGGRKETKYFISAAYTKDHLRQLLLPISPTIRKKSSYHATDKRI